MNTTAQAIRWAGKSKIQVKPSSQTADATSDQGLVAAIQAGDRAALAALYDRYAPQMLGVAMRILQNRRDAEDLLHDTFLEIWHKAKSYDPERASVRTWLLLRVRSRAIDRLRALTMMQNYVMAEAAAASEENFTEPSHSIEQMQARRALAILPEAQRRVLELGYFQGLSCQEIATVCDVPIGTIKSRLAAALVKLRQALAVDMEKIHDGG